MEKLKEIWGYVVAGVVGLIGVLVYIVTRRGDEINKLKSKVALTETQKQADALEVEIKQAQENKANLKKENQELDKTLQQLDSKREEIKKDVAELKDPKAIADYWNKS